MNQLPLFFTKQITNFCFQLLILFLMAEPKMFKRKLRRQSTRSDMFESLHDDIIIYILCKLSLSVSTPSDFIVILLTCKRMNKLGVHRLVLLKFSSKALAIRAKNWCPQAHRFLKLCVNAGNIEAYYILGMIQFYCLQNRASGMSLLAKAAVSSHTVALYSLALIMFNGSGGLRNDKDLRSAVALCDRAAVLGHIDALRELGHCFQDGYGVSKNVPIGRRLLVQANAREIASVLRVFSDHRVGFMGKEVHPANKFMVEWFGLRGDRGPGEGLRMCSYDGCGRPETRKNEFRRCSGCGKVNYCSRGCQAHDWRVHKVNCAPIEEWMGHAIGDVDVGIENGENDAMDDQRVQIVGR